MNCSPAHATTIIEGAMRLHNVLVGYHKFQNSDTSLSTDLSTFNEDAVNVGATPVQIGNDLGRPHGNITVQERENRKCGLKLREILRQSLKDHGMHHPTRDEWYSNLYNHTLRH